MNNLTGKIVSALVVVFLLAYAGYQAYRYIYQPYRTEIVYEASISDTVYSKGLVVRWEEPLSSSGGGVVSYAVAEAEKVSVGYPLAYYYENAQQAKDVGMAEQLEAEIALLQKIQEPGSRVFTNNDTISGHIDELVGELVDTLSTGSGEGSEDLRTQLQENICKRQLSVNAVEDFNLRIDELSARKRSLEEALPESVPHMDAPGQGYFSRYVDGYETTLKPDVLKNMTADELAGAVALKYSYDKSAPGKLVHTHTWYYATVLSLEDGEKFRVGETVYLTFDSQQLKDIPMEVDSIRSEGERTVVVLRSDTILPGVLSMRSVSAEIDFQTYSGLKVNESALRMVDGMVGVYVLTGSKLQFKPVQVIYNGPGYKLCTMNFTDSSSLKLFDEIVVEGTDLYDGKSLL